MAIERVLRLVGRGHTLEGACAQVGWTREAWEREQAGDPTVGERLALARARAKAADEAALLEQVAASGAAAQKAREEMEARRRVDWGAVRGGERGDLERVLGDPAAFALVTADEHAALAALLAERKAIEARATAIARGVLERQRALQAAAE